MDLKKLSFTDLIHVKKQLIDRVEEALNVFYAVTEEMTRRIDSLIEATNKPAEPEDPSQLSLLDQEGVSE